MDTFAEQLQAWQVFYSTVALAAVTLAGLLFVSLSLRQNAIHAHTDAPLLRLARHSFGDFLYVLMLGLVFLVPFQEPMGLAIALFVLGLSRGYGLARQAVRAGRTPSGERTNTDALRELALPALASAGLLVVGVAVLSGELLALYGLVIVIAALLATASWNAWLILMEADAPDG